tara:strand:- start:107 stop:262 length:156 start_codon:yes stop_codon:yes gene_type:complete
MKNVVEQTSYHDVFHNGAGCTLPVAGNGQPEFGLLQKRNTKSTGEKKGKHK